MATSSEALIRASGIIHLWQHDFVEAVAPPVKPLHVFARQIMALAIQQRGIGCSSWREWLGRVPAFNFMVERDADTIINYIIETGILSNNEGTLWLGYKGEQNLRWHDLRHTFGTKLGDAGYPESTIAQLMGHTVEMAFRYTHATEYGKRAAVEAARISRSAVCHNPATNDQRPVLLAAVSG